MIDGAVAARVDASAVEQCHACGTRLRLVRRSRVWDVDVGQCPSCGTVSVLDAATVLAGRPNLRLVIDPYLGRPPVPGRELRGAGGAVLVTESDTEPDDPATWIPATTREPSPAELGDLDLAWRVARHVKSNAIVLVRAGAVVGVGAVGGTIVFAAVIGHILASQKSPAPEPAE